MFLSCISALSQLKSADTLSKITHFLQKGRSVVHFQIISRNITFSAVSPDEGKIQKISHWPRGYKTFNYSYELKC